MSCADKQVGAKWWSTATGRSRPGFLGRFLLSWWALEIDEQRNGEDLGGVNCPSISLHDWRKGASQLWAKFTLQPVLEYITSLRGIEWKDEIKLYNVRSMWSSNFSATQFYQNTHYWHIIYGFFCAETAEWNNFDRDSMAHRFSSVQSFSRVSLWPHGLQHARPFCPAPTPQVYSNSCPLSRRCHPAISSSVVPFSSCLQSFPASRSFQMSQFLVSGGQSIGVSASASVLPMNIQDWFPLGWTGWISLQSKGLSRVFSNTTVQKHQFFGAQLSL